ncbi:MAG: phosphatase PAP2 family protein [Bacteroidota bacterium]
MHKIKLAILLSFVFAKQIVLAQTDSIAKPQFTVSSYIIPAALVSYGLICFDNNGWPSSKQVQTWRNDNFASFNDGTDDLLVFGPGLLLLSLDACKVKSASNFPNQAAITAKAVILSLGIANILKYSTQVTRPDGSADNSFPSGHSVFAFTLAEVLHQEFKNKPLVYISGYTMAAVAASMRILNNRHWFSDVLVGAGIGIAATKLVYSTHQYKWKMNKGGFMPIIGSNQMGFVYQF